MASYPFLEECFFHMLRDQVMDDDGGMWESITTEVPEIDLKIVNNSLGRLTEEERETISIGDRDDWPPIYKKIGASAELVHKVLDNIFERIGF